jgi:hypothetical protein
MIRHRFGGNLRAAQADSASSSVTHRPYVSVNRRQPGRLCGVEEPAAGRREAAGSQPGWGVEEPTGATRVPGWPA